ncbi:FAD-dependent oxidoreductase [Arthrobacter sp. I2-34]|uniref:FAD-dependent oxidoreductase n=1 Tax=Arthrobacter hankyongi TaxID=2904801 RepID=A0ABS9LBR6_9MICC|nr:FAD-dependent oxidoreductase [Arthrobacter hankyongi]MCG2623958.1 FAD-dependent oxidoreductase [Arthrobacter hankyongi]
MRLVVDLTKCQGYGQCAFLAPDVFAMQGDEALVYDPEPADGQRRRILRAAAACPVQAIRLDGADWAPASTDGQTGAAVAATAHDDAGSFRRTGRIVIVGASLAGLRAAEQLRAEGFAGSLILVGDELHEPYDRVPLSKQVQSGWVRPDRTALPRRHGIDAQWRLGVAAAGLDVAGRQVHLADGTRLGFDRLLIATGLRARPWPDPAEAALAGVLTLRTRQDAAQLRRRLAASPARVLVVGAGFIGSEIASVCRELGLPVTVAEAGPAPLRAALGTTIGAIAGEIQRDNGVDLRCGTRVAALEGDGRGRLRRARFADGTVLEADIAVVALGGTPNVEWLAGSGLASGPWGVACDAGGRVLDTDGQVVEGIFAAGDVSCAAQPLFGNRFLMLEHWGDAVSQAGTAAHNMAGSAAGLQQHLAVPKFWSVQFGHEIKSVGVPALADEVAIAQGSVPQRRFLAVYGCQGRIVAAVAFNQNKWLDFYEPLIAQGAAFPPSFSQIDGPAQLQPVPAGFRPAAIVPPIKEPPPWPSPPSGNRSWTPPTGPIPTRSTPSSAAPR